MNVSLASLACAGCGAEPSPADPYPFRCAAAGRGDDVDHVLVRRLDFARTRFPSESEANPYVRYRHLLYAYHAATAAGLGDADVVEVVQRLDERIAAVWGGGFATTPFAKNAGLGAWVKDETGNVAGSHKGRHLMGVLMTLELAERARRIPSTARAARPLAIASCGNAALAAAVLARAAERPLDVYVPEAANPAVVTQLRELGARVTVCPRSPATPGDPSVACFRRAIDDGALPFSCQGTDNGLAVEGGVTLGYEIAARLAEERTPLDRLFVQVGGGALASACIQALGDAVALGAIPRMPRIHAVQTRGAAPLARAYERLARRILARLGDAGPPEVGPALADRLRDATTAGIVAGELGFARTHRSAFMWPWEEEPRSAAEGILDDETYDWAVVVEGMIATGGFPIVVDEPTVLAAREEGVAKTGIQVSHTGSAGLAGLTELRRRGEVAATEEVGVIFSGRGSV